LADARPGWYHGVGDPDGTVRYWDGEKWIGEPVQAPTAAPPPETAAVPAAEAPRYGAPPMGTAVAPRSEGFFARLVSPHGRVNRATYAGVLGIGFALAFVLAIVDLIVGTFDEEAGLGLFSFLSALVWLWPQLATSAKRFHDQGFSGWFAALLFIPFAGLLVILWLVAFPGKPEENKYGPPPTPGFRL
jgi:uncharacterized membrane protein YhaH (DUF805 family)